MRQHFTTRSSGNQIPSEDQRDIANAVIQISQEISDLKKRISDIENTVSSLEKIPEPGNVRME